MAKICKQPKLLTSLSWGWVDKEGVVYTYMNTSRKTEWNSAISNNIDEPEGYYV